MQKKFKCLISIFLSLLVIVSLAVNASAVTPRYSDTNYVSIILGFSGTTANCDISINGADGTTSISNVNITLKDSGGNIVAEWPNLSSASKKFTFFDTVKNLTKGETYTLAVTANVNRNGKAEPVSNSITKTCPQK